MANLRQLFDLQKIADNSALSDVINETNARNGVPVELGEDELEFAVAGVGSAQYMEIACNVCGYINNVNVLKDKYVCKKCGTTHRIEG